MESHPEVAFLILNGSWLGLYAPDSLAEDAAVSPVGSGFSGFTLSHNVSLKMEMDEVMAEALKAGATHTKAAQRVFWGGYSGYFEDPDGYLREIAHNPLTRVGPEDI